MFAGLKLLIRDWRGGELGLLIAAIILATGTITCIQIFSDRLNQSLLAEASEFMAGDATIKSTQPISFELNQKALELDIQTSNAIGFRAMIFAENNGMQISAVKGVDNTYPLKGSLEIETASGIENVFSGPNPTEVWLAPRLFSALNVSFGDTLYIGEQAFTLRAKLLREPDNAQSFFGVAPRAMIHQNDIEKTGAIQIGSRINYVLTLAGTEDKITTLNTYFKSLNNPHYRWQDVRNANRSLGSALSRAEEFLMLTGSLGVILCGLAIALAARRYATRQIPHVAMLKTFGLTPNQVGVLYLINLTFLGIACSLLGVLFGWLFHYLIVFSLGSLFTVELSSPHIFPFFFGALSGFSIFIGFAITPILKLRAISPAATLRLDEHNNIPFNTFTWLPGFAITLLLIYFYSQSVTLSLILVVALAACALGVGICTIGINTLHFLYTRINSQSNFISSTSLRLGLASIFRHRKINSLQIFIFSTLLMLLFTLTLVRTQLIEQWQNQAPEGTPNHFIFNIFDSDKKNIKALLTSDNITHSPFYPMTRGRLVSINSTPIDKIDIDSSANQNYERELNLTWSSNLGKDNKILSGVWWSTADNKTNTENFIRVSAEESYAKGLGLKVGDLIEFSVSGEKITSKLTSIRSVQWDSMNPNFYMIFDQPLLDGTAANWLTSFYLPSDNTEFVTNLLKTYPTLSVIELDQILTQVQKIIEQVTNAVELVLLLVLAAGTLVLFSSIQASLDIRKQESAIVKTLGGDKRLVQNILLIEFSALGAICGILGTIGSSIALFFLQTRFMNIDYQAPLTLWLLGPIIGTVLVGFIGWISTRKLVHTPPMQTLRDIA